jgi:hypothetical protein
MKSKYLNAIYKNLESFSFGAVKIFLIIFFYIILVNFFIKNSPLKTQIFYVFPIFFIFFIRNFSIFEKTLNWFPIFFFVGIIDDVIFDRILGLSSIYYLIFFSIFLFFLRKFKNKSIFFYLFSIGLIFIHYFYSILFSMTFFKSTFFNINFEINKMSFSEISLMQANSLFFTIFLLIMNFIFFKKNDVKYIFDA